MVWTASGTPLGEGPPTPNLPHPHLSGADRAWGAVGDAFCWLTRGAGVLVPGNRGL